MSRTDYAVCSLCEAVCGLAVEHDGERILSIRGDAEDTFSEGHVCPKAVALKDVLADPDRLRRPMRRVGDRWHEVSWEEALTETAERLVAIQRAHGSDAVAFYYGNPTAHSLGAMLLLFPLIDTLATRNVYSSNSVDALPRMLASTLLYGNQSVIPIPDLERTQLLLVLGANPLVSNGSVMTAPNVGKRLERLRQRGGRLIVVDPRRTETADVADVHHPIRPGTDALLVAALLQTIFAEGLARPGRLEAMTDGLERLRALVAPFTPERVAGAVGIPAPTIAGLARELAASPAAVCYARMGIAVGEFGALASCLVDALNVVTGNLDRVGGAMFCTPAADLAGFARMIGQAGAFGRWKSRVGGLPEFNGELPAAALADEIETPGPGQIRALVTHAGNPVLSYPNGRRLDGALAGLDFMVAIDIYVNETTRHAHFILPPTFALEHDHYALLFHALAVRNTAHFAPAILRKPEGTRHDWEIMGELMARLRSARGGLGRVVGPLVRRAVRTFTPRRALGMLTRFGPHRLSLRRLEASPHGIDLGPLEPRLPGLLDTPGKRIRLVPAEVEADFARLAARLDTHANGDGTLLLIGRRTLRSNNSWMHNAERLVRGRERCTLLMHPADAAARGLAGGERVTVTSRTGGIEAPLELSDAMMPGVVSLPHGWGHDRPGTRMDVARTHAGVSFNDVADDTLVDRLCGTSVLNGVPVRVAAAGAPSA
jgi:anaerobic selenocysteine-containing dehydrogenase